MEALLSLIVPLLLLCIAPHQQNAVVVPILRSESAAAEDIDLNRWSAFREREFHNLSESSYKRNEQLLNGMRQREVDWSLARSCRIASQSLSQEQCFNPAERPQSCFGVMLQQNYTVQDGTFGAFPKNLEFLRHFPRCWKRIAPIICLGHYRPCALSTTKNDAGVSLYVMLEQFSANACFIMLDHCALVWHNWLSSIDVFPSYLNCYSHYDYHASAANQRIVDSAENTFYKEQCRVNPNTAHPELAALGRDAFQCLWPLVWSADEDVQASLVIDGCYLPCQSPLFPSKAIGNFQRFGTFWYFIMLLIVLVAIGALILNFNIMKRHRFPINLYAMFACTFFLAFIGLLLLIISIFPFAEHRVLGEFATCLPIGGANELIRRSPTDFSVFPAGNENLPCIFQAFLLDFCLLSINWSFLVVISKILLLQHFPRFCMLFPSWNSGLLPVAIFVPPLLFTFVDLFSNMMSVDPVNGICHFFLHGHSLSMVHYVMYPLITAIIAGLIWHLNWVSLCRKVPNNNRRSQPSTKMNQQQSAIVILQMNEHSSAETNNENVVGNDESTRRLEEADLESPRTTPNTEEESVVLESDATVEIGAIYEEEESAPLQNDENAKGNIERKKNCWRKIVSNCFLTSLQAVNLHMKKLVIVWLFLLASRTLVGHMLIAPGEEIKLVLESIECSINRTFTEGIPLDFVNPTDEYERDRLETNPHIRKQILGKHISAAQYCELQPQQLGWYWLFTLLLGSNFSVVAVMLLALMTNFTDHLKLEQEFEDEKEAQKLATAAVELREINKRGNESNVNDEDEQQQHPAGNNAGYERISDNICMNSSTLPLLPPNTSSPPLPPRTAAAIPSPPQSPPPKCPVVALELEQTDTTTTSLLLDDSCENNDDNNNSQKQKIEDTHQLEGDKENGPTTTTNCMAKKQGRAKGDECSIIAADQEQQQKADDSRIYYWEAQQIKPSRRERISQWMENTKQCDESAHPFVDLLEKPGDEEPVRYGDRWSGEEARLLQQGIQQVRIQQQKEEEERREKQEERIKQLEFRSFVQGSIIDYFLFAQQQPATNDYFDQQQQQLLALQQQQQQCCSMSLFPPAVQQALPGTAQQSTNSFVFNKETDGDDGNDNELEEDELKEEDEVEEVEEEQPICQSPEPSSSRSENSEDEEEDSNAFNSDSADSFEEKRWEELMKGERAETT